jgi:hypothetical protein
MPTRKQIGDLRFPNIKGLPDDDVHLLHHCIVQITRMRRSIDETDRQLALSYEAVKQSCELLMRLQLRGL